MAPVNLRLMKAGTQGRGRTNVILSYGTILEHLVPYCGHFSHKIGYAA